MAAVPLCLVRRRGWPALVPLGAGISDYTDVLLTENTAAIRDVLTTALLAEPGWRLLELPELRPDALALHWTAEWPGRVTQMPGATSLELPGVPLDVLLARLPGRTASVIRRKLRKTDALGVVSSQVPVERTVDAVTAMLKLHEEQWRGRGINAEHLTRRFVEHLTGALPQMVADGQAVVVEHRLDGEMLGSQVNLVGHDLLGYYLAGISPRLKERIDVASLLIRGDVEMTVEHGLCRYSLMRGEEDYKLRWRPERIEHTRLICARPGIVGAAGYPAMLRAKQTLQGWIRTARRLPTSRTALVTALRSIRGAATGS
ncbi:GNAT family N-acetyltransferase [Geodermatophilus sp. DF01-2]|uniref:GNAT family N-acetyltransferase n=1 Tax=Geodermatophilus sp. DF01-2 TaxID=2559610 RepID=UPI00107461F4|nr:GNAT family N-acetyltransferase [Geodermatophilus sp. DF01_2]TFV62349.1 GNAT family N-acetyltransferase [Geodermatophilus sp. DF01_2]